MAEEHRCQAPEGHRLCVNNCGFFGSPATMNLCSKCYRDLQQQLQQKQQQQQPSQQTSSSFIKPSLSVPSSSSAFTDVSSSSLTLPDISATSVAAAGGGDDVSTAAEMAAGVATVAAAVVSQANRCFVCRKRVGLTGFKCRCGTTFCGTHRYPEKHGCTFDFKKLGREEIAKANPMVKAEKLEKI